MFNKFSLNIKQKFHRKDNEYGTNGVKSCMNSQIKGAS